MPDSTHKTVSASQVAALFNISRWSSRWMLYQNFARGMDWTTEPNDRMKAGLYFQSAILRWAGDELGFTITEHAEQTLLRHPGNVPLSATKDASMQHPVWGPGLCEAKLVLYSVWKERWTDTVADPEVVMQVQAQLAVEPHLKWARIACYREPGGLVVYDIQRNEALIADIEKAAEGFMQSVSQGIEPPVEGLEAELPSIIALYPETKENTVLTVSDPEQSARFDEECDRFESAGEERLVSAKLEGGAKAYIYGTAKDYNVVQSQYHTVYMRVDKNGKRLTPKIIQQENW